MCYTREVALDQEEAIMKPYSADLRQKIVETYYHEKISQRKLARRFNVSLGFIVKILKQDRETGNLEPKKGSGRPLKLNEEQREILDQLVEEENDWTLEEYQSELEKRTGVWVSRATVDRMTKRSGFTVKKRAYTPQRKKVSASKPKG